jgi:hypothetical protein
MKRVALVPTFWLILAAAFARADDKFSVKAEKAPPPKELSEPIQGLLDDQALRLLDGRGEAVAVIWLRKSIPSKAAPEQVKSGLTYREIPETTVIGAIQFPQAWLDYRKQKIPAGVYTLRLAFQPQNGDHMGTAPYNEFLLLSPAAKDAKSDKMEPKELHELSSNATGSSHPAVMLLFPNPKPGDEPKLEGKPNATWVLNVKRVVDAAGGKADLGFGLTVAGHTTQE